MPIYEYRCQKCEHEFDALQKISDPLLTDCPECHEAALKKLVSAPSFRLKGGGWYETDFKKDKRRNLADGGDGKSSSDSNASGDGKSSGDGGGASGDSGGKTPKKDAPAKSTPAASKSSGD